MDQKPTIASLCRSCNTLLKLYESRAPPKQKGLVNERLASFSFWTKNIGAFAGGRLSADSRLECWPELRSSVVALLSILIRCIESATNEPQKDDEVASAPSETNISTTTENVKSPQDVKEDVHVTYAAPSSTHTKPFYHRTSHSLVADTSQYQSSARDDDTVLTDATEDSEYTGSTISEPEKQMDEVLFQLHEFLMNIRRESQKSRNLRATRYKHEDIELFRNYMTIYVEKLSKPRFPTMPDFLCQRLIATNVKRRNDLEYMIRHTRKLARDRESLRPQTSSKGRLTASTISTDASKPATLPSKSAAGVSVGESLPASFMEISADLVHRPATEDKSPAPTHDIAAPRSSASSVGTYIPGAARYPKPPLAARRNGTQSFNCPYCGMPLKGSLAQPGRRSRKLWESHIKGDIRPYICIFKNCVDEETIYSTRRDWLRHMSGFHSKLRWICSAKPHITPLILESEQKYIKHLEDDHYGQFKKEHLKLLVDKNASRSLSAPLSTYCSACPFCGWTTEMRSQMIGMSPDRLKTHGRSALVGSKRPRKGNLPMGVPDKSMFDSDSDSDTGGDLKPGFTSNSLGDSSLEHHIAGHLHEFALLALPLAMDDDSSDGSDSTSSRAPRGSFDLSMNAGNLAKIESDESLPLDDAEADFPQDPSWIPSCSSGFEQWNVALSRSFVEQNEIGDVEQISTYATSVATGNAADLTTWSKMNKGGHLHSHTKLSKEQIPDTFSNAGLLQLEDAKQSLQDSKTELGENSDTMGDKRIQIQEPFQIADRRPVEEEAHQGRLSDRGAALSSTPILYSTYTGNRSSISGGATTPTSTVEVHQADSGRRRRVLRHDPSDDILARSKTKLLDYTWSTDRKEDERFNEADDPLKSKAEDPVKSEAIADLKARVENWRGLDIDSFGGLVLFGTHGVNKDAKIRTYHLYLFERIFLCCSEIREKTRKRLFSFLRTTPAQSSTKLRLKGRIFLLHIKDCLSFSRPEGYSCQIGWKGESALEYLTLVFDREDIMREWSDALYQLTKLNNLLQIPPQAYTHFPTPSSLVNLYVRDSSHDSEDLETTETSLKKPGREISQVPIPQPAPAIMETRETITLEVVGPTGTMMHTTVTTNITYHSLRRHIHAVIQSLSSGSGRSPDLSKLHIAYTDGEDTVSIRTDEEVQMAFETMEQQKHKQRRTPKIYWMYRWNP